MLAQYQHLLEQICAAPDLPIEAYTLVTPQARMMLPDASQPIAEPRFPLVAETIAAWREKDPRAIAISQGQRCWSYDEVWRNALAVAHALRAQGVRSGDVVAISGPRSFGFIAAMVGVLTAGGVLLTVERKLPLQRQRLLLREARAGHLVYVGDLRDEDRWLREIATLKLMTIAAAGDTIAAKFAAKPEAAANAEAQDLLPCRPAPDDPAYIFFTSGTTGTPKGILGNHKGLAHFLDWQRATFAIGPGDRFAHLTGLSFDVLLRDVFRPLTSGARLHLPPADDLTPATILPWLGREKISALHTVPTLAQSWLADPVATLPLPELRCLFFSGEPLTGP